MTLLEVNAVSRAFGTGRSRHLALDRCSVGADPGEILGIVGPNGAGKTTLLRLIAGEIPVSSGQITVAGHRAGTLAARRVVGFAADPPSAPPELTVTEWLGYLASHRVTSGSARARQVSRAIEVAELNGFVGRRLASLSRGMAQRVALGALVAAQASVLVLDETLSGVDPLVHRRLRHQIVQLASQERLVLIASHDLSTIERFATRVLVLVGGRIRSDVRMTDLLTERVAEISLSASALASVDRLLRRLPGATRTGQGIAVPLKCGTTVEQVLAVCREYRVAVAASRVRYRALEDILVAAAGGGEEVG